MMAIVQKRMNIERSIYEMLQIVSILIINKLYAEFFSLGSPSVFFGNCAHSDLTNNQTLHLMPSSP